MAEKDDTWPFIRNIIQFFFAVVGFWRLLYVLSSTLGTRHLGDVIQDKKRAGYFAAVPSMRVRLGWILAPIHGWRVSVPEVPAFGDIISAGDKGAFTSAMIAGIERGHFYVSWRPIYEAFFQEQVWTADKGLLPSKAQPDAFYEYLYKAEYDVREKKRWAERNHDRSCCGFIQRFFRGLCRLCIVWPTRLVLWEFHHLCALFGQDPKRTPRLAPWLGWLFPWLFGYSQIIRPLPENIHEMDHHLFYYPWQVQHKTAWRSRTVIDGQTESGARQPSYPKEVDPILVSSLRQLDELSDANPDSPEEGNPDETVRYQGVWIHEGRPAVEMSDKDIATLSLFLGADLQCVREYQPSGRAGFGLLLVSDLSKGMTTLHVDYGDGNGRRGIYGGYSTLYAKYIACSCLPFSTVRGMVQTLGVTSDVLDLITRGKSFCDQSDHAARWRWAHPACWTLTHMPGADINFYYAELKDTLDLKYPDGTSTRRMHGCLYRLEKDSHGRKKWYESGTLWHAVAGIAFGGLVPAAMQNLVSAVAFTLGGKLERVSGDDGNTAPMVRVVIGAKDIERLDRLMELVLCDIQEKTGASSGQLRLFGLDLLTRMKNRHAFYDFGGFLDRCDHPGLEPREVVIRLGNYTTLLEVLIAKVSIPGPAPKTPAQHFEAGKRKREAVFEACASQIQAVYEQAIQRYPNPPRQEKVRTLLQPVIRKLEQKVSYPDQSRRITADECAQVARAIIMLWTRMVRFVDWHRHGKGDRGAIRAHEELVVTTVSGGDDGVQGVEQIAVEFNDRDGLEDHSSDAGTEGEKTHLRKHFHPISLDDLPDVAAWE